MRVLAFGVVALAVSVTGGCAETELGFGEECIKDSDCLSGVCAAQVCADPGRLFTDAATFVVPVPGPEAGTHDAATSSADATADAEDGS